MSTVSSGARILRFAGFELDPAGPELRRDGRVVALRPKSLALICHLAQRPGQLVRKEDLVDAVWGDTAVTDATLARTVFDAREALGDDSRQPRFLETVHRLGFRFLLQAGPDGHGADGVGPLPEVPGVLPSLVGRRGEAATLDARKELAARGRRQVVFVTGDPGIGKTSVLDAFLSGCRAGAAVARDGSPSMLVARGQCIEHYGAVEAYLPFLDALGELCRGDNAGVVVPVLRRAAPTWLAQLPWLVDEADRAALDRELRGVTSDRMLRELAQALEILAEKSLLVLALEDLHWCDSATADLLAFLARRSGPARLLVLATYRPVDAVLSENPIRPVHHELSRRNLCEDIVLDALSPADVADLVARRFPDAPFASRLADVVHRRTGGNPLFVVGMLADLVSQGRVALQDDGWKLDGRFEDIEDDVPLDLLRMVRAQVERLDEVERVVVEAASVAGVSFSAAAAAAALDRDVVDVEESCEALARQGVLLERAGTAAWPDGTSASAYSFRHALYGDALYDGIPAARRRRLHGRVGERLERAHASDPTAVAGVLGRHFGEAGDHSRAARYLRQAAEVASRRGAPREALALVARVRAHLAALPEGLERTVEELMVEMAAGPAVSAIEGYSSLEAEQIFTRARERCRALGDGPQLFPVLWGLWAFWCVRGRIRDALELAGELFRLAEKSGDPELILEGHHAMWVTSFFHGDMGATGRHVDAGIALYDRSQHHAHVMMYGQDPGVVGMSYRGLVLQAQGREKAADLQADAAMQLGRDLGHPVSTIFGVGFRGWIHQDRGEADRCRPFAEEVLEIASSHGLAFWHGHGQWIVSRSMAAGDPVAGIAGMRGAIEVLRTIGAAMGIPGYLATLARVVLSTGDRVEARRLLDESRAIGDETGDLLGRAEMLRVSGDFAGAEDPAGAEGFYREAMDVARQQDAAGIELAAALDLARLLGVRGRATEVPGLLRPVLARIPADEDSAPLREARALAGA